MSTAARKEPGEAEATLRAVPRSGRRPGWLESMLTRRLRRNVGLRLISLLLALGLWIFVNAGQHGAQESFIVPVTYRNLPPHMTITGQHPPTSVKIEVSGPRTLLSLIDPNRLTLKLDLAGATVGQTSLRINPEAFAVPRQTAVIGVTPSQIVLDLDEIKTRSLPVHLALSGDVANGYQVAATEVIPRTTAVRGPSRELARLDEIETEPIDLSGATGNLGRMVELTLPFGNARMDPTEVTANIEVTPIVVEKEFRGIPIQVRGYDFPFRLDRAHVNLTVRGAQLALAKLDLQDAAYVNAEGMAPGSYDATVEVTLPDGVELVHQSATKVKLRLYRERRAVRH